MSFDRLPREMRRTSIAALRHRDFRLLWFGPLISFSRTVMNPPQLYVRRVFPNIQKMQLDS